MTKRQKNFYDYLQKLKAEEREDTRFVETALKKFFKYWEMYEKQGCKDSMTLAMESTEAFGYSPSMDKFITEAEQFIKDSEVKKNESKTVL